MRRFLDPVYYVDVSRSAVRGVKTSHLLCGKDWAGTSKLGQSFLMRTAQRYQNTIVFFCFNRWNPDWIAMACEVAKNRKSSAAALGVATKDTREVYR